jgi:hypothetical protein
MIWPLLEGLKATAPLLPQALFTRAAVKEILAIARAARGSVDVFGFECRLSANADRVDLGVRLLPEEEAAGGIPGRRTACRSDEPRSWLRAFTRDPVRFRQLVSCVYLEYDADSSPRSAIPSVFLPLGNASSGRRRGDRSRQCAGVEGLLVDLMGRDRFAACKRTLDRCLADLPAGGRILVAGAMLGRSPQTAHLSISLPRSRVGEYLGLLGWPYWSREISDVVKNLDAHSASVLLDFDVGASIGPTVGAHFATENKRRTRYLCTRLAELGFCTAAKKEAVITWPGGDTVRLWKRGWPCRFERYLDHVKIVCAVDGVREAKAYLGVAPSFSLLG